MKLMDWTQIDPPSPTKIRPPKCQKKACSRPPPKEKAGQDWDRFSEVHRYGAHINLKVIIASDDEEKFNSKLKNGKSRPK